MAVLTALSSLDCTRVEYQVIDQLVMNVEVKVAVHGVNGTTISVLITK